MIPLKLFINHSGLAHNTGDHHPENIKRLQSLMDLFEQEPFKSLPQQNTEAADIEYIARAHPKDYIFSLQDMIPEQGSCYADGGDTVLSPGSFDAALDAAGAACMAVDQVMSGDIKHAFCATRPPGHHAEPAQAMGFCLFNNAVIAALHAQSAHNISRAAIIDFDVHHGNGSDTMARKHDGLFYASSHQFPFYPNTGDPKDNIDGRICNVALAAGEGSAEFRRAYIDTILPALDDFAPEILIISAGFDAHIDDPLAEIYLDEDDFKWITEELVSCAERHCDGKIISILEGGYNLEALKSSVAVHLQVLATT